MSPLILCEITRYKPRTVYLVCFKTVGKFAAGLAGIYKQGPPLAEVYVSNAWIHCLFPFQVSFCQYQIRTYVHDWII